MAIFLHLHPASSQHRPIVPAAFSPSINFRTRRLGDGQHHLDDPPGSQAAGELTKEDAQQDIHLVFGGVFSVFGEARLFAEEPWFELYVVAINVVDLYFNGNSDDW